MIGNFIAKGIPKCADCVYYRLNRETNIGLCIKFLGSHDKPIQADIARYNDLMCGYHATQHKTKQDVIAKEEQHLIPWVICV
jgi:hypothetical protein